MNFVPRQCNQVAHSLARLATAEDMNNVWFIEPPECIRLTLAAEHSALIP